MNGESNNVVALIDTGSTRSCFPDCMRNLGVLPGGFESTKVLNGARVRVVCGVVALRPLRVATQKESDAPWVFTPLTDVAPSFSGTVGQTSIAGVASVHQIVKLEGTVATIGLNTLAAWGVCVNPRLGMVRCR